MIARSRLYPTFYRIAAVFLIVFVLLSNAAASEIRKRTYKGFTLWLDCEIHHGAVAFYYELDRDRGHASRKNIDFRPDQKVPSSCQPRSRRSYRTKTVQSGIGTWDRGHLVAANHMDESLVTLKESFLLTNTLPQHSDFNQEHGAWHQTELITECYREISKLKILGGVIWGTNMENDFFTQTHGIKTPDFWWKIIYRQDQKTYVAWLFPNSNISKSSNIDDFLIAITDLKIRVDYFPEMEFLDHAIDPGKAPVNSWPVDKFGDRLTCENVTTSSG